MNNNPRNTFAAIISLVAIVMLSYAAIWAADKARNSEGPSRMVKGGDGTVYVVADGWLLELGMQGKLQNATNISSAYDIDEPLSDLVVSKNGERWFGLRRAQEIWRFSSKGEYLGVFPRPPSDFVTDTRVFGFTIHPETSTLFFADTVHHRLELFDGKHERIRNLETPSGDSHVYDGSGRKFRYPFGLTVHDNRVYLADTDRSRVVVFFPDGTYERIIRGTSREPTRYVFSRRVSVLGSHMYIMNLGPRLEGGEVVQYDMNNDSYARITDAGIVYPQDVFAINDGVLVLDGNSYMIRHYSHDGRFLGNYGDANLLSFLSGLKTRVSVYRWIRYLSYGGLGVILIILLILNSRSKKQQHRDTGNESARLAGLRSMSVTKRRALLSLVPGLGYFAAGAYGRLVIMFAALLTLFIGIIMEIKVAEAYNEPLAMYSFATYSVITGVMVTLWWVVSAQSFFMVEGRTGTGAVLVGHNIRNLLLAAVVLLIVCVLGQLAGDLWYRHDSFLRWLSDLVGKNASVLKSVISNTRPDMVTSYSAVTVSPNITRMLLTAGLAMAVLFYFISREYKPALRNHLLDAMAGFMFGVVVWIVSESSAVMLLGGGFIMPFVLGALAGLVVYFYFAAKGMPMLVILAAVALAWMGSLLALLTNTDRVAAAVNIQFVGTWTRTIILYFPFVFMLAGILVMVRVIGNRNGKDSDANH